MDKAFNSGLELCLTWVNRILFLKLLESQLLSYHNKDPKYRFLNAKFITDYDELNDLFFSALAKKEDERHPKYKEKYKDVPYLNSSLFERNTLENEAFEISSLNNDEISLYSSTVLKDANGKRLKGKLSTLDYLFRFLDAYDFATDGKEGIEDAQETKSLINASVLGLIFEKINGYKEGSFYTPAYITMYMCRETLRRAVVQKFKEQENDQIATFEDLHSYCNKYFKIDDLKRFNTIVDSLRICDPAVGSGHFLVSALNELIVIKNELGILVDAKGLPLRCDIEIVNDELYVIDDKGDLFEYRPNDKESVRIQHTLFHQKQTLIENCLFGVDINPNSVKICRLRLWIELLKNAYYTKENTLQTLPNIDINIKCGNSLISRFNLSDELKDAFRNKKNPKLKHTFTDYKNAVAGYKEANSKERKREVLEIIKEVKDNFKSTIDNKFIAKFQKAQGLVINEQERQNNLKQFGEKITKKDKDLLKILQKEAEKKLLDKNDIVNNAIYHNAFEWRFEFPEVLEDNGRFVGFDAIIGNPPYVFGGGDGISTKHKKYFKDNYEMGSGKINLFNLFIERSNHVLKSNYEFAFIIPNTFLRVTSYDIPRKFSLREFKINSIYDFGDCVFEDAVTTAIVITATKQKTKDYSINIIAQGRENSIKKSDVIANDYVFAINTNPKKLALSTKLKSQSTPLGELCNELIFGVVITKNKDEVVSNKNKEGWKPFLEGKEIGSYSISEVKQWLNYDPKLLHRARTKEIFEANEKILIQRITGGKKPLKAAYDSQRHYNKESINNIILNPESGIETKYALALINSSLINWFYSIQFTNESNLTVNLSKTYLAKIPIKVVQRKEQETVIEKVDQILNEKSKNAVADTTSLERDINQMVYQLYGLTDDEIKIVENAQ